MYSMCLTIVCIYQVALSGVAQARPTRIRDGARTQVQNSGKTQVRAHWTHWGSVGDPLGSAFCK